MKKKLIKRGLGLAIIFLSLFFAHPLSAQKSSGSHSGSHGSHSGSSDNSFAACSCHGGQYAKVSFVYSGPDNMRVRAFRKSNLTELVATFPSVVNGQLLVLDATGQYNGKLKNKTFLVFDYPLSPCTNPVWGNGITSPPNCGGVILPTNCGDDIMGQEFGPLMVVFTEDKFGESCSLCDKGLFWKLGGNNLLSDCNELGTLNNEDLVIITNNQERMRIMKGGEIQLHGIAKDNGLGQVLVEDASGIIHYRDISTFKDADSDPTNELQDISLSGNDLSISNGSTLSLGSYLDNTDDQNLTLNGNTLSIEDGNNVDLSIYLDDTDTDDQTLSLAGNNLSIADGNTVDLSGFNNSGTDDQNLTLSGNTLTIEDGNNVDLSSYLDNTDNQTLSITANQLTIAGGNTVNLPPDGDSDSNNELQSLLSTASGTDRTIDITNGSSTTFSIADNDNDATNEIQDISLTGNDLSLSNGSTLSLGSYIDNTDDQVMTLSGNMLSIEDGNTVDLSLFNNSGTDDQNLTLTGNNLSIEDGNNVDLSSFEESADIAALNASLQTHISADLDTVVGNEYNTGFTWDGQYLKIADNGSVMTADLVSLEESGEISAVNASLQAHINADLDTDSGNELVQGFGLIGHELLVIEAGDTLSTNLAHYMDNTDNQDLSSTSSGTTRNIDISGGSSASIDIADNDNDPGNELIQGFGLIGDELLVMEAGDTLSTNLAHYMDNTDNQDLSSSSSGTTRNIDISGGSSTSIDIADNDNSSTNELITGFVIQGNDLKVADAGGVKTVGLGGFLQSLNSSESGTERTIGINGGTGTTINIADYDSDSTNELITGFVIQGNDLKVADAGGVKTVGLGGFLQSLTSSASGTQRTININAGTGTTIDVADNDNDSTNEYIQAFGLNGHDLSVIDAGATHTTNLAHYMDNTDTQDLSISGSTISLTNGGSVTVPSSADNLGNHTTTTNLQITSGINRQLRFGTPTESSDPTYFVRWGNPNGSDWDTQLRLYIHDNATDRFSIYGNSCAVTNGCSVDGHAAEAFAFRADGKPYKPGGGSWLGLSDRRLKTDIKSFTYGLKALKKIKTVTYRYNGKARINSQDEFVGVIAQDLQKIAPFMVSETSVSMTTETGKEEITQDFLSVDPNAFTYMLINSVQEQQEMIEDTKVQMEEMQAQMNEMKQLLRDLSSTLAAKDKASQEPNTSSNEGTSLNQNVPNPFTESTSIRYNLARTGMVAVTVYDLEGRLVNTLISEIQEAGSHEVEWKPGNLTASVYLYKLTVNSKEIAKRMILIR